MISFLVTYYNQEKYVRKSLDSILAIEKKNEWEILVGDDGSTDHTIDIVEEYIERYPRNIRLYVMPREEGAIYDSVLRASANRLNLLKHSKGQYFCILDGDDFFCDENFVSDAIGIFENNPGVSVVAFGYRYYFEDQSEVEKLLPGEADAEMDADGYIRKYYLHAGACVHRKSFEDDRIEYLQKIGYFDDNDIVMNDLAYGKMYYIGRSVYSYRQAEGSVYSSMNEIEKAVLNVRGYDADIRILPDYSGQMLERNAEFILTLYIYRYSISKKIGDEKYKIISEICQKDRESLTYQLLFWNKLSAYERKKTAQLVFGLIGSRKKLFVKILMKSVLRGLQK